MPQSVIPPKKSTSGFDPRQAAWLSYVAGPFTGLFFLLTEGEDLLVRFHAWHSVIFGGLALIFLFFWMILSQILGAVSYTLMHAFNFIGVVLTLGFIAVWAALIMKAYQGSHLELPVLTDMARRQAEK